MPHARPRIPSLLSDLAEIGRRNQYEFAWIDNYASIVYYQAMNDFDQCPTEGAIGLVALLIKTGRHAEGRIDDALEAVGLTFIRWRALDTLVKADEPIGLTTLAEKLHCVKSNVTQIVDKIEADGQVRRVPAPNDRRGTLLVLTEAGYAQHRVGREALEAAMRSVLSGLDDQSRQTLHTLLFRL